MVKKSLLLIYRLAFWLVGIVVTIVLLAALAIQFFVFPNINQYKEKIATFASKTSKQKVVIGGIKADWQGINPHLSLSNIDIYDAQNRLALQLKNTEIAFSWLSIPLLEPHLAELTVHSPELTIRRITSGEIFVAGISMSGAAKPELPNWLLRQSKSEVVNAKVVWLDEMRGAPALSLNKLNLQIISPPWKSLLKNHRIVFSAVPSVGTNNPIVINGNVYGNDVSHINQWSGSMTSQLKNANIVAFKPWIDYPIDLQTGIGSSETEVVFTNHQLKSITSDVSLTNVKMQLKSDADPIILSKLAGKLHWENLSISQLAATNHLITSQLFSGEHLTLVTDNGLNILDATASYSEKPQGEKSLSVKLAHINLATINPYLAQLPLPEAALQKITGLATTGSLENLVVNWEGNQSATKSYVLNTKFTGLSIQAHDKLPGFTNLTGEVKVNQKAGRLTLLTKNAILDFKDTLRWPLPADTLEGVVSWNIKGNETRILANDISISSPHLSGIINADYLLDGNKGGYLDLKAKFDHGNAKYALFYYPNILGKDTLHWLDTSILSGELENINVITKGRLADFPFVDSKGKLDSKLGLFRATAQIKNSEIEYGLGWPNIEALGLDMLFEGTRMELNANTGHILGNQLIKSKITIAQLDADEPILNVVSELKGPVLEGINFVNKSPVALVTQGFTDDLKTSGTAKLNLRLEIPLNNADAAIIKGAYQINNGSMQSAAMPLLSQINGMLEFTESSLAASNVKASVFGSPLVFNLNSGKDKIIRVTARGKLNDEVLKQTLGKGANYISGNTDWVGDILIQKPRVNIGIRADLFGVSSRLPAPLNKSANEHLNIRIDKRQDANTDTFIVNIGNKIGAKVVRSGELGKLQLDRANINFNNVNTGAVIANDANSVDANSNGLNRPKGLQLTGNLDYLDADAWRTVMNDLSSTTNQNNALAIQKIDLKINTLDIFDRRINQLKISNKAGREILQATVESREISGDLQWLNQNNGKLIARLSHLSIPDASPNRPKNIASGIAKDTSNKEIEAPNEAYPALDITADSFEFDKKEIGGLELLALPQGGNWSIQKFRLINPESTISADGIWSKWVRSPSTKLNINWDINDLGKTLNRFGYVDAIKGGEGVLKGQLNWAGSPHEFDTLALNGNLDFEIRKGQILKVQPGVGRLLGLLSLQSLPRRLTLDFRDLFSNGFAFDKINANVKIDKGIMRSDNFLMTGPAANVTIKGETNLQKETQQLYVKVMPNISDSFSLAALAGGPLVGAVAFLAQKILKDPLNKIASTEYQIIGTWDNPQEVNAAKNSQESIKESPLN